MDAADSTIPCGTTDVHASRLWMNTLTKDNKPAAATSIRETVLSRLARPVRQIDQQQDRGGERDHQTGCEEPGREVCPLPERRPVIGIVGAEGGYQQYPTGADEPAVSRGAFAALTKRRAHLVALQVIG